MPKNAQNTKNTGKAKNYNSASDYQSLDEITHLLARPDTMVGSLDKQMENVWIMLENEEGEEGGVKVVEVEQSHPIFHIFLEMLTNASDNADRSRQFGVPIGKLFVQVEGNRVLIRNNGVPIPVEIHDKEQIYVPQMIFGQMRTGINFGDVANEKGETNARTQNRRGAGRNGFGAKIGNILSRYFRIRICDTNNRLEYSQIWRNNMRDREEPVITPYEGEEDVVEVEYELDFERFNYPSDYTYTHMDIAQMRFITSNNAMSQRLPAIFNEESVPHTLETFLPRFRALAEEGLISDEGSGSGSDDESASDSEEDKEKAQKPILKYLFHHEWPKGTKFEGRGKSAHPADPNLLPDLEIILMDARPDQKGVVFSTTSGAINTRGGVHVNLIYDTIATHLATKITKVSKAFIRAALPKLLNLVVIYRAENPRFSDQTKVELKGPKPSYFVLSDKEKKALGSWNVIEIIERMNALQDELAAKKTDGKRRKDVTVDSLRDANFAGSARSAQTSLCLVEGKSATNYPEIIRDILGADYIGILHGRGVPINAMNAKSTALSMNKEYVALKQALGLVEGVNYEHADEVRKLRYGSLWLMADADDDGIHITGLFLLMLRVRFPGLIRSGFVKIWCSPIIRARKGKTHLRFYTRSEFEAWRESSDTTGWEVKYLKGLGVAKDEEVIDDVENRLLVTFQDDPTSDDYLKLAFHEKYPGLRKLWLHNYLPKELPLADEGSLALSEFFAHRYIQFSLKDVCRSLPGRFDGLKPVQRKIVYGMYALPHQKKDIKVATIGLKISDISGYHHGHVSLLQAMVGMSQRFAGANNYTWIYPVSQAGTRSALGKNAADPRYLEILPNYILRDTVVRKIDDSLTTPVVDEGTTFEPETYYPVIPMLLVNGSVGIGTGFQASWPPCDPVAIVSAIRAFLDGKVVPQIKPYYHGFTGDIKMSKKKRRIVPVVEDLDLPHTPFPEKMVEMGPECWLMSIRGRVEREEGNTAIITELPIDTDFEKYHKYLKELKKAKTITAVEDHCQVNRPFFRITGHPEPIEENLQLCTTLTLSNLVAVDELGRPQRYNSLDDYFLWWCKARYEVYERRKDRVISHQVGEVKSCEHRIAFLKAYLSGKIKINKRPEEEILADMQKMGFDPSLLETSIRNLTEEGLARLQDKLKNQQEVLEHLKATTPADMWREDLKNVLEGYNKYNKRMAELKPEIKRKGRGKATEKGKGKK